MTSTSDLLLEWDRRRPRSQQKTLGMSELGDCKRRAGYRLAGQPPTDAGGSVQAVLGTAVHDAVAAVLKETAGPDDLTEHEVEFAGVIGHLDRYEANHERLVDVKTTSSRWLEHIKRWGPDRSHRYQTAAYAAALIKAGRIRVRTIRIDYIARDTGEEWSHERPFDPVEVAEALGWLAEVRDADLDMLPREYAPASSFCGHCPFRSVCWGGGIPDRDPRSVLYVEDPDAAAWAEKLLAARADKAAAEAREAEAKGALDALRPLNGGIVDVGFDQLLRWSVSYPKRIDTAQVKADYAAAGATPPYKPVTTPTVKLDFTAPEEAEVNGGDHA